MKTLSDSETMRLSVSQQPGPKENRRGLLLRVCTLLLMLTGLSGMAQSVLDLQGAEGWCICILCGAVIGTGIFLALQNGGRVWWWALAVPAAAFLLCLMCRKQIYPTVVQMTNRVLKQMQLRQERLLLPLSAEGGNALWGIFAVAVAAGALLSLIVLYARGFAALLLPLWLAAGMGYLKTDVWLALFSLGCILTPLTAAVRCGKKAGIQTAALTGMLLALCAAAVLGSGLNNRIDASPLRRGVTDAFHALRYEKEKQALPEGRFDTGKEQNISDASMLELKLNVPATMYLRGMSGAEYDETGWKPLSGETLSSETDRFYWLTENGFSAATQLSALANALGLEKTSVEAAVTVTGACREYLYLPAELAECESLDSDSLKDGAALTQGLRGAKQYSFTAITALSARADELMEQLELRQEEPSISEYLRLEESYRGFVYEHYLTVPEDCDAFLQTIPEMKTQPTTSYEVRMLIREVLTERAAYSPRAALNGGGVRLLRDVLGGKQTNSAQYATTAVLMLRKLGIPARYAEGFVVLPGSDAGTVTLTGKDAHAWAEYYEDGVGWIPFETVPDYVGLLDEAGWPRFRVDSDALQDAEAENSETEERPEPTDEPESEQEQESTPSAQWDQRETPEPRQKDEPTLSLWPLLFLLLALLLLSALWLVLRRRKILRKRQSEFESPDLPEAITALFAHSVELMRHSGFRPDNVPLSGQESAAEKWLGTKSEFHRMCLLNEEALFSNHTFKEAQRREMRSYEEQTLSHFKKKLNWRKRVYQQWICCMY